MPPLVVSNLLGLLGAIVGGAAGFALFGALLKQGLYGLVLPGALLGLGCQLLARHRSVARGGLCGAAGLVLGLVSEWYFRPFQVNGSFVYFLKHISELNQGAWSFAMLVVGAAVAAWWGGGTAFGRRD